MPKFTCSNCGKPYKNGTQVKMLDGKIVCWKCFKKGG